MGLRNWREENSLLGFAGIEFYAGMPGDTGSFHTDKIKPLDGDFTSLADYGVPAHEYMNGDAYSGSVYADCHYRADFSEWSGGKDARVLCFLLKEKEE